MYLKRLDIHGFKSFATPTSLTFVEGITCVVGPNGCGKSNLVDAVRWVMGEQRAKALRSDKMENVLFNGSGKRKPLGMAEVKLTVENTKGILPTVYRELTLGRRLYRSGESEYLMGGVTCRLRDVQELFMDTGMGAGAYSVIELSMVEEILSENPEERRHLFEEAAGITRYKLRRKQALSKLADMQANVARLNDLTSEVESQVRSLKRQAEKAARHKQASERKRLLEQALTRTEAHALQLKLVRLSAEEERLSALQRDKQSALTSLETARAEALAQRTHTELHTESVRSETQSARETLQEAQASRDVLAEKLRTAQRDWDRLQHEIKELEGRITALSRTRSRFLQESERLAPALEHAHDGLRRYSAERTTLQEQLHSLRKERQSRVEAEQRAERERTEAQRELDRRLDRKRLLEDEKRRLEAASNTSGATSPEKLAELEHACLSLRDAVAAHEAAVQNAELQLQSLLADERTLAEERRKAEHARGSLEAEQRVLSRLVATYSTATEAVQFLATQQGWSAEELLTVSDVLRPQPGFERAFEAALGPLRQCPVVHTEAEAQKALGLLQDHAKGQTALIVLENLPYGLPDETAYPSLHAHCVPVQTAFAPLADVLLSGWYLADTPDEALHLATHAAPGSRFITREGMYATREGIRFGGKSNAEAPLAPSRLEQRERLAEVIQQAESLGHHVARLQEKLRAIELARKTHDPARLKQELHGKRRALAETEAQRERAVARQEAEQGQREQARVRLEALQSQWVTLHEEIGRLEPDLIARKAALQQVRESRTQAERFVQEAERQAEAVFQRFNEVSIDVARLHAQVQQVESDLERTSRTAQDLERQRAEKQEATTSLQPQMDGLLSVLVQAEDHLRQQREGWPAHESRLRAAQDAYQHAQRSVDQADEQLALAREERQRIEREERDVIVQRAQVQTRLEAQHEEYERTYNQPLNIEAIELPEGFEPVSARAEVRSLNDKLAHMGQVNPLALEAFEEESQRLTFLTEQLRDVREAEATLTTTINEINSTAAERFTETFALIRAHFSALYTELFGEDAFADIVLVRPEDVLESPVEIKARPGGKRPLALTQLSGGEKTLTAIALLFAIYQVKPSPFCILDEVDAPLDEANVDRFMRLIRRFSSDTQFLLITHNKRTMELADRLYGVTMQEPGVSTLVGVSFDGVNARP